MKFFTWMVAGAGLLLASTAPAMQYALDEALKPENLKPKGQTYAATVPDTLDLAERGRLAVRGLTNFLNPKQEYAPFGQCYFNTVPPYMSQVNGSPGKPNWGKITDGIIMSRMMSGSDENLDIEAATIRGMLNYEALGGSVPTARTMMAMMSLYRQNPDPAIRQVIETMAASFKQSAKGEGDEAAIYFDGKPDLNNTKLGVIGWGWKPFIEGSCMRGLARWGVESQQEPYIDLATRLMHGLIKPQFWQPEAAPKAVYPPDHAQFTGHHHSFTSGFLGLLRQAEATHDERMKQFVREGYEYLRTFGIARVGLFGEGCTTGDMTYLAIRLSTSGVGDYWDDVDSYVRNQLMEMQITDAKKIETAAAASALSRRNTKTDQQLPADQVKDEAPLTPIEEDADNVAQRNVGAFLSDTGWPTHIPKLRFLWTICCTGNCTAAMYQAWNAIVEGDGETARVNLLLNRASQWLDVDSYLPYEGKVVFRNKGMKQIAVRIPGWVDRAAIKWSGEAKDTKPFWVGHYLTFSGLAPNAVLMLTFPVRETKETYSLKWKERDFWIECTDPGSNWKPDPEPTKFTFTFRGNTVVDVFPRKGGGEYQLYQRDAMKADKAPMHDVQRFVSAARVDW